jgi:glycosyltransferase involved in cell wall biosynthesis
MRILYLTQYFPPEIGATQTRAYEMARGLVRAGHEVTVIAEVPNHPAGIVPPAYRGKLVERANLDGIDVIRVWVRASQAKTFGSRIAFYLSFMAMATAAGHAMARGHYDLQYASSPPLFVGAAALALAATRRIPFVFEVRDLWPESAVQLGELKSPAALRWATWLEEACYRRARRIVAVTASIRDQLVERGYPSHQVMLIPNGANTELYSPRPIDLSLRQQLGITPDQFVVIYTGLHGLAQGLETALDAASLLQPYPDVLFYFVGDGPRKPAVVEKARQMGLSNVRFHDAVPEPQLPAFIAMADAGLHTSRRLGISAGTLPVKMFSYMACARPVIVAIEGEAAALVQDARAGVAVPPEDSAALAAAVLALRADQALRTEYGRRGRTLVQARFSRQALAGQLERVLQEVICETN